MIVNFEQGSPEWLEWRNGGVTATNAIVIGADLNGVELYPEESVWRLWAEKLGRMEPIDLSKNPNVVRGKNLEDEARQAAEKHFQDMIIPVCVESDFNSMVRASLDGLLSDGSPVELKCPSTKVWEEILQEKENSPHYKRYWMQVQHQLLACGALVGFLCFYLQGEPLLVYKIDADKKFLGELFKREKQFWEQVQTQMEPEKDPMRDKYIPKGEVSKEWIYASEQYKFFDDQILALKEQLSTLEESQKPFKEKLTTLMGGHKSVEYNGLLVTRYERPGAIDSKKLIELIKQNDGTFDENAVRKKDSEIIRISRTNEDVPRLLNDEEVNEVIEAKQESGEFKSAFF